LSLYTFLKAGGVWSYPLLLLSVLVFAAILERLFFHVLLLRGAARFNGKEAALYMRKHGNLDGYTPKGRILDEIRENATELSFFHYETAREIVSRYQGLSQKRMGLLSFAVTTAPLLGILGTISGIISSFWALGAFTLEKKELLTAGISEALLTTAAGLTIAIVTLAFTALIKWMQKEIFSPYGTLLRMMQALVCDKASGPFFRNE